MLSGDHSLSRMIKEALNILDYTKIPIAVLNLLMKFLSPMIL